jgi:hypothetical protein
VSTTREETEMFDGYQASRTVSKTVYSNGFIEMLTALSLVLLMIPISALILGGSVIILRQLQTPAKCSELLTTRYAIELGRLSNG